MIKVLQALALVATIGVTGCTKCSKKSASSETTVQGVPVIDYSGLKVDTLKPGTGAEAQKGKQVTFHYTGKLDGGSEFDSSHKRKAPLTVVLGSGQLIPGFDKGIEGMKVGELRRIKVPSELGYGSKGVGTVIPPNSNLEFEVELLRVE